MSRLRSGLYGSRLHCMRKTSVKKFFENIDPDVFRVILDNVKPSNELLGITIPDIVSWRFCDVMGILDEAVKATPFEWCLQVLVLHGKATESKLLKADSKAFIRFLKHVKNEIEKIGKLQEQLQSEPEADLINAGIDELNRFGSATIYYSISKDPGEWDRISELPYGKLYTKLLLDKVQGDIQKRYNQIQIDKSKQK